jgi:hypothetical protein
MRVYFHNPNIHNTGVNCILTLFNFIKLHENMKLSDI